MDATPSRDGPWAVRRRFADGAATWFPGHSERYAEWAAGVAGDGEALALVAGLPEAGRNPLVVFAAARFLGLGDDAPYAELAAFLAAHRDAVAHLAATRRVQTNEAGRCATLLPALARIAAEEGAPLALVEAGASAGLCLLPDRYSYRYDGGARLGDGSPLLECATTGGPPLPDALPAVAWRAGIDLHPVDAADPGEARWLEALVWPGQRDRLERLRAALRTLRAEPEPPDIVAGDVVEQVAAVVARAPSGAVPVVFHSAVLAYLDPGDRARFASTVRGLPCRWVSNESFFLDGEDTVPGARPGYFTLAVDGVPVAHTGPHGAELHWLPGR